MLSSDSVFVPHTFGPADATAAGGVADDDGAAIAVVVAAAAVAADGDDMMKRRPMHGALTVVIVAIDAAVVADGGAPVVVGKGASPKLLNRVQSYHYWCHQLVRSSILHTMSAVDLPVISTCYRRWRRRGRGRHQPP